MAWGCVLEFLIAWLPSQPSRLPFLQPPLVCLVLCLAVKGFRAGYIAGSFMIGRLVSSTLWGLFSDKFGRKPVLAIGCLTITVTSILFGFCTHYVWALVVRFLGGLGNGITATAKVCTSEVAHQSHASKGNARP